jgi:hypothetical protein
MPWKPPPYSSKCGLAPTLSSEIVIHIPRLPEMRDAVALKLFWVDESLKHIDATLRAQSSISGLINEVTLPDTGLLRHTVPPMKAIYSSCNWNRSLYLYEDAQ